MTIFNSTQRSAGAPGYPERTGQTVDIVRPLTDAEHDRAEVGQMFRIRFDDGIEADAFEDELQTVPDPRD